MLFNNIFVSNKNHRIIIKFIYILIVVICLLSFSLFFTTNQVEAAQYTELYKNSSSVSGYPRICNSN